MHDFVLPIGPQHPSIKEPTCLRITLDGNYIQEARIRLGYQHRGVEKLMEGKEIGKALHIVGRICGICTYAHTNCFTQTIEKMANIEIPKRVKMIRTIMTELERLQSHMLWLGFMFHEIGLDTYFMYFWRDRERVIDIFERVTGGRIHHHINRFGSVAYDIREPDVRLIKEELEKIKLNVERYLSTLEKDHIVKKRMVDVGIISRHDAKRYCLVGPVARASGIRIDVRKDVPYDAYDLVSFDLITENAGDSYSRTLVRIREVFESIKIIRRLLKTMPNEKLPKPEIPSIKEGLEWGMVEAPRGEDFHFVSVKNNVIQRHRIRPPTFNYISILEPLLKGAEIGDVPVITASLDPCFACLERVIIVRNGREKGYNEQTFKQKFSRYKHV